MSWTFLSRRIKREREKIQVLINITTFHKYESTKSTNMEVAQQKHKKSIWKANTDIQKYTHEVLLYEGLEVVQLVEQQKTFNKKVFVHKYGKSKAQIQKCFKDKYRNTKNTLMKYLYMGGWRWSSWWRSTKHQPHSSPRNCLINQNSRPADDDRDNDILKRLLSPMMRYYMYSFAGNVFEILSIYASIHRFSFWLTMTLAHCNWMMLIDAHLRWLTLIDADWCLLMLIHSDWCWWILIGAEWCWLILRDAREWRKSERTHVHWIFQLAFCANNDDVDNDNVTDDDNDDLHAETRRW